MISETIELNHSKNLLLQTSRKINSTTHQVKSNNRNRSSKNNSNNSNRNHSSNNSNNNNNNIKSCNSSSLTVIDSTRISKEISLITNNEMQRQLITNKREEAIIHRISLITHNLLIQLPIRALKQAKDPKIIVIIIKTIALLQLSLTILLLKLVTSSMVRIPILRTLQGRSTTTTTTTTTRVSHHRRRKPNRRVKESQRILLLKMVICRNNHPKATLTARSLRYSS